VGQAAAQCDRAAACGSCCRSSVDFGGIARAAGHQLNQRALAGSVSRACVGACYLLTDSAGGRDGEKLGVHSLPILPDLLPSLEVLADSPPRRSTRGTRRSLARECFLSTFPNRRGSCCSAVPGAVACPDGRPINRAIVTRS
jgi:hypothetical protein